MFTVILFLVSPVIILMGCTVQMDMDKRQMWKEFDQWQQHIEKQRKQIGTAADAHRW